MKMRSSVFIVIGIILSAIILMTGRVLGDKLTVMREDTALREEIGSVVPEIGNFSVSKPTEDMPESVKELYIGDKSMAVRLSVNGYAAGLELLCGIKDGKVINVKCVSSRETLGAEKTYGEQFIGKDTKESNLVDTVSGATKTTSAYKQGILDALSVSTRYQEK